MRRGGGAIGVAIEPTRGSRCALTHQCAFGYLSLSAQLIEPGDFLAVASTRDRDEK